MVLENRVLRRIFGLKRAVNSSGEGYVKYYIVTCITKYLGGQIKKNEMAWARGMYGGRRDPCRVLMARPEVKTLLERPRRR
jgi:hypothetical protein